MESFIHLLLIHHHFDISFLPKIIPNYNLSLNPSLNPMNLFFILSF